MSDDPLGDDPYRTAPYRTAAYRARDGVSLYCPRCDGVLTAYHRVYECGRECGLWMPIELVRERATIADLAASDIGFGPAPAQCAQCVEVMAIRRRGGVVFDVCAEHGVWLDTGERHDFERAFAGVARRPGEPPPWRGVMLRALLIDAPRAFSAARLSPDATESEELAWLDGARARLDDEPR